MRILISIAFATSLIASGAFAADNTAPLAAGKPAGVHKAQSMSNTTWALIGIGALTAIAVGVAAGSNGSNAANPPPVAVTTTTA